MTQVSRPQAGRRTTYPDAGPYTADEWAALFMHSFIGDDGTASERAALRGVIPTVDSKLVVTNTGGAVIRVATGAAWVEGYFHLNDANVDTTVSTPAANRNDRVVLVQNKTNVAYDGTPDYGGAVLECPDDLTDYEGTDSVPAYSCRLAILTGVVGGAARNLTQDADIWMIELASYTIDNGGNISSLTDQREFAEIQKIVGVVAADANTDKDALIIGAEVDDTGVASGAFGVAIRAMLDDAGGTLQDAGRLVFAWKTATAGAEVSSWKLYTQYIGNNVISGVIVAPGTASPDGNTRGNGAVDWQGSRTNATEVASGLLSTISGGNDNTASASYSTVGGGTDNVSSGQQSTVAGGSNCTATQTGSTVAGGSNNDATGGSAAIAGGSNNDASALRAFVGAGDGNVASGQSSVICGGEENNATVIYSCVPGGYRASADLYGQVAHASGRFAADGDAQGTIQLVARCTTAGGGVATTLYLDGAGASQTIVIPADTAWTYDILVVAMRQNAAAVHSSHKRGVIYRDNAGNTTQFSTTGVIVEQAGGGTTTVDTPGGADESLRIQFTDDGANVYRAVATIRLVQVSYP